MEYISKINNDIYFGAYPNENILTSLDKLNVKLIVDLTHFSDGVSPYSTTIKKFEFPIVDRSIPPDEDIIKAVIFVKKLMYENSFSPIYIHCKKGHGRSCLFTSLLYGYINNDCNAFTHIKEAHSKRDYLDKRVKLLLSPLSRSQEDQINRLLCPIYIENTVFDKDHRAYFRSSSLKKDFMSVKEATSKDNTLMVEMLLEKLNWNRDIKRELLSTDLRPFVNKDKEWVEALIEVRWHYTVN
jgi:protein-tyrosine phosphatase